MCPEIVMVEGCGVAVGVGEGAVDDEPEQAEQSAATAHAVTKRKGFTEIRNT